MIKELIKDLTFDKINLSQGLNRAKLIAYEIENDELKNWISKELNGYSNKNDKLPEYRVVKCDLFAVVENSFTGRRQIPMDLSNLNDELDLEYDLYEMRVVQSISTLEKGVSQSKDEGAYGYEEFPISLVPMLRNICDEPDLVTVKRRIQFSQLSHILNLTKQKLIDTLLELKSAFPNLEDNYINSEENKELAKTIINNHIYGDNSSSNIGVGENISQEISNVYNQKIEKILSDLEQLNVPKEELETLRKITKESDKKNIGKRILAWTGNLSQLAIEKGIELQIPLIIEKVQDLL